MKIQIPDKIKYIIDKFYQAGYEAFAVGGCVRDALLGLVPHDWDITTNATPDEIKDLFADYKIRDTGIRYGTVTLIYEGEAVEITAYRKEGGYTDNRHPEVITYVPSLTEDLKRRDFTINAMAYNDRVGLVDNHNGVADVQNRIIRTVGNSRERLDDDALRILRGLRFAATLGFDIDSETAEQMHRCKDGLQKVSVERIKSELHKIMLSKKPSRILSEFHDIFEVFIPELSAIIGLEQNHPYHCYDVFHHTLTALDNTPPDKIVRYSVFFHDFGKGFTKTTDKNGVDHFHGHPNVSRQIAMDIMKRLTFSRKTRERVALLVKYHDARIPCDVYNIKKWLNRFGAPFFRNLLLVKRADICGQNPAYLDRLDKLPEYERLLNEILAGKQCVNRKSLAINGNDLIQIGFRTDKKLGKTLDKLLEEVMKNEIPNEKAALLQEAQRLQHIKFKPDK